jgi:hypothetical protein
MKYCFLVAILLCGLAHASTSAPRCNPGDYSPTVNWQVAVASDQSIVSILWCNDSTGLNYWATGWNPAAAPVNECAGNIRDASATLLLTAFWSNCMAGAGTLTAAQQTSVNQLLHLWMPKLQTPAQQAVFQYANGKLEGTMEGRVVAHAPCGDTVVATSASNVDYYDVSGQKFTDGTVIPANSAAVCRLVTPPAAGW